MLSLSHSPSLSPSLSLACSLSLWSGPLSALLFLLLCSPMCVLFTLLLVWVQRGAQRISAVCHWRPLRAYFFPEAGRTAGRVRPPAGGDLWPPQQTQHQKSHGHREERGRPIMQKNRGGGRRKACCVKEQQRYQSAAWTELPRRRNGCSSLTLKITLFTPPDLVLMLGMKTRKHAVWRLAAWRRQPAQAPKSQHAFVFPHL